MPQTFNGEGKRIGERKRRAKSERKLARLYLGFEAVGTHGAVWCGAPEVGVSDEKSQ